MDTTLENMAETTTEFERNKRRVKEVNSLLRKAFARPIPFIYDVKGNLGFYFDETGYVYSIIDEIGEIGTINPSYGLNIGKFTERDGSSIRLFDHRYLDEIRRYAELYKAQYGKEVQIEIA